MMINKRFKVHSMIQGMEIGETMDLELCEELIKKYGSLSDIHLLIEDNGNDMTYQEVVDLLNENEQLKKENYELHKRLGDFEPFEEHIKERTSKTSINDIVGLVKTDESTDIVELKKELKE